jgi:hypothetical protein
MMDKRILIGGIATAMSIATALVFTGTHGLAQTKVMAPGAQIPGVPLPRYVYTTVTADFAVAEGQPLVLASIAPPRGRPAPPGDHGVARSLT